jgi:hypothetical protein
MTEQDLALAEQIRRSQEDAHAMQEHMLSEHHAQSEEERAAVREWLTTH